MKDFLYSPAVQGLLYWHLYNLPYLLVALGVFGLGADASRRLYNRTAWKGFYYSFYGCLYAIPVVMFIICYVPALVSIRMGRYGEILFFSIPFFGLLWALRPWLSRRKDR